MKRKISEIRGKMRFTYDPEGGKDAQKGQQTQLHLQMPCYKDKVSIVLG